LAKRVTVLIPSAGRPHLIAHVLKGLRVQTFTDFEVLLVLRPNDTETIEVAKHFSKYLNIRIVFQKHRGLLEAYNEGIDNVNGDVILFLDDDAVPEPNCVREHLLTYERNNVSGVSGDVIPAYLENGIVKPLENASEVVAYYKEAALLQYFGHKFWNRPLEGQENYLAYISKAGYSKKNIHLVHEKMSNSLLCMAANMSVLTSALKGIKIPVSFLKRGIAFEQVVGWKLWKNGHRLVFNSRAKAHHIKHGQTMSRSLDMRNLLQAAIEEELLFYYFLPLEEKLSKMHRIVSLLYNILVHVKKTNENWKYETTFLSGIFLGNIIGLKWIISRAIGGSFEPIHDSLLK